MARDDELLLDILIAARRACDLLGELKREDFEHDEILQLALTHLVQIIGEAASGVSAERRSAHPEIAWHEMVGMRHRIVHDYTNVNPSVVWETVKNDLPSLIAAIESLVSQWEE